MANDMEINNPLALILYCIDEKYRRSHSDPFCKLKDEEVDWGKVLSIAEKNKLSYSFSQRIVKERCLFNSRLYEALVKGRENISKLRRTLNFIFALFEQLGRELIIIKLYKGLPYITYDVDVLVREEDFQDIAQTLERQGMVNLAEVTRFKAVKSLQYRRYEGVFWKNGLLQIELYTDFSWAGLPSLDSSVVWESPRRVDIHGIKCPIPSREADILLLLNHALFKDGNITLLDFLYINSLLKKNVNFSELFHEAEKYGWGNSLLALISTLRNTYQIIYQSEPMPSNIKFPYAVPLSLISHSVWKLLFTSMTRRDRIHPFTLLGYGLFFGLTIKDRYIKSPSG
ncbi:MAG: nucleotidyltransferase family protein [Thermoproteota archaeon]